MKLYLAYGANTNAEQMKERCPDAKYVCNVTLRDHRLVFRGVADIVPCKGAKVTCAMFAISAKDEEALDRFEGFPWSYVKRYVTLMLNNKRHRMMFYVMRKHSYEHTPSESYEECVRSGYAQCGMPQRQVDRAILHAQAWIAHNGTAKNRKRSKWDNEPEQAAVPVLTEVVNAPSADTDADAAEAFMFDFFSRQRTAEDGEGQ